MLLDKLQICRRRAVAEQALAAAEQLSLALANLRLKETLRTQSIRDPLTGLFNRRYLEVSLERELQRSALLSEMFGPPPSLDLNMARLTIGASDFSLQPYTLDDVPFGSVDPQLQHFNVAANLRDVIPTMREALAVNPQLQIIASPWSAPAWMKTSENLIGAALDHCRRIAADAR